MPTHKIREFVSVLILTLALAYGQGARSNQMPNCECDPVSNPKYRVAVQPKALKLLAEVEAAFGRPVCIGELQEYKPNEHGKACITKDGTPVVKVNPGTDDIERTMVHELYHLKFRADGFPDINYYFPDLEINRAVLQSIDETFRETIEHWMFFPAIRKMGIDPASRRKAAIRAGEYKTIDRTDVRALAYRYYETKLLVDDAALVSQLAAWYKANGLTDALEKGEELARLVTDSNPRTPEDEVSTYIKVLNAIPESTARFQLESWKCSTSAEMRPLSKAF